MKILLTNDDGIDAPGIRALAAGLSDQADTIIVAPANEKSASSHSITLGEKLRVVKRRNTVVPEYEVHGTPADCVKIAIAEIEGYFPDMVISGINQGANTGVSVFYSGTISAAREGLINRVPAMAVSLCSRSFRDFNGAVWAVRNLLNAYEKGVLPKHILLNVNVPPVPQNEIKGIKITKQAESHFIEEFIREQSHGTTKVYTLAGEIEIYDPDGTSDEEAVNDNYISVTPLKLDMTDYEAMQLMEEWLKNEKTAS